MFPVPLPILLYLFPIIKESEHTEKNLRVKPGNLTKKRKQLGMDPKVGKGSNSESTCGMLENIVNREI